MNIVSFIPPAASLVVEFGCADGEDAALFKKIQPACKYIGIENDIELAHRALEKLDHISLSSFSEFDFFKQGIFPQSVDCIIYRDTNSELHDFENLVKKHMFFLKPDGQILIDLENSCYARSVCAYLLDNTELKRSPSLDRVKKILAELDFHIVEILPYYDRRDEEWKGRPEVKNFLAAMIEFCNKKGEQENQEILTAGYLIRVSKAKNTSKNLLLQTMIGEEKVCARVRIYEPHSFLQTIPGVHRSEQIKTANLELGRGYSRKILIRQRIWSDIENTKMQLQKLLSEGYLVIGEIDDDPMKWGDYHEKEKFIAFRGCHALQTSTPELAEFLREFNPNVKVFENQIAVLPDEKIFLAGKPITLFFGALNREVDWKSMMPVLNRLLKKYGSRVFVKVIYDQKFFAALETTFKEFIPFCPYEIYTKILHESDIAFLPLIHNRFNSMKSDLKFIECAAHSVVAVASPTVYGKTLEHGVTGFLYKDEEALEHILAMLIENDDLRQRVAKRAYCYVKENRLLSQHYQERYIWYTELLQKLPELNRELIQRVQLCER